MSAQHYTSSCVHETNTRLDGVIVKCSSSCIALFMCWEAAAPPIIRLGLPSSSRAKATLKLCSEANSGLTAELTSTGAALLWQR